MSRRITREKCILPAFVGSKVEFPPDLLDLQFKKRVSVGTKEIRRRQLWSWRHWQCPASDRDGSYNVLYMLLRARLCWTVARRGLSSTVVEAKEDGWAQVHVLLKPIFL